MARNRWLVVPLLAVVLAACHRGTDSSSRPTSTPRCRTDQLLASLRAEDGSAGHYHAALLLTNTARTRCAVSTPMTLQMLASDGQALATSARLDDSTGRPPPVLLAPSRRASVQVTWVEISSGEPCVAPARLQVFTPDRGEPLVVAWPPDHDLVCGHGVLTVQPARFGLPRV